MHETDTRRKLRWQCRRGLLELDMVLEKFLEEQYPQLSPAQQADFAQLLATSDQELLGWFFDWDGVQPAPEALQIMVELIKNS